MREAAVDEENRGERRSAGEPTRLFGPAYPQEGSAPLTQQTIKSAFELASGATFSAGESQVLHGRPRSGT